MAFEPSSQSNTEFDIDNYEWDDAQATETAWKLSKKLQRGKRAYGRRAKISSENDSRRPGNRIEQDKTENPTERRRRGFGKKQRGGYGDDFVLSSPRDGHRMEENQSHDALAPATLTNRPPMREKSKRVVSHNSSEVNWSETSIAVLENLDPNVNLFESCTANGQDSEMEGSRVKKFRSQSMNQTSFMELNKLSSKTRFHRRCSTGIIPSAFSTGDQQSPTCSATSKSRSSSSFSRGSDANFYGSTQSSFSSIRDSAQKLPQVPYDIEGQSSCMTPSRCSSVGSSRKRGVCDSPIFHGDDCDGASLAMSHQSSSSYTSRRARSRIFSPQSTSKMMDELGQNHEIFTNANADQGMGTMRRDHDDSGDGSDSDPDESSTSGPLAMSFDTTDETHENEEAITNKDRKKEGFNNFAIPSRLRRMSSCERTFEDNIFVPVEKSPTEKVKEDVDIFATMSSYEDLKFLIKALRRWSVDKQIASFGMSKACIIVPPNCWKSERKAGFMSWTTSHLGFSHRSGGGVVTYIQTSATKGRFIQKQLEKALLEHKKKNKPLKKSNNRKAKEPQLEAPFSSIKIASNTMTTPFLKASGVKTSERSELSRTPMSVEMQYMSPLECDIDAHLVNTMNTLHINNSTQDIGNPTAVNVLANVPEENRQHSQSWMIGNEELETHQNRTTRLSYDNSVLHSRDFMSHLHGISPHIRDSGILRPSALVLPCRNIGESTVNVFSPPIQAFATAALSFDCAETPMPKSNGRIWGSKPVEGKDWGVSIRCNEEKIAMLMREFENARTMLDESNVHPVDRPYQSSPCLTLNEFSKVAANSRTLGFEFEADSAPRGQLDQDSAEGSESEKEDDYEIEEMSLSNREQMDVTNFADLSLDLHDNASSILDLNPLKMRKRREKSYAKHNRMSICLSALKSSGPTRLSTFQKRGFADHGEVLLTENLNSGVIFEQNCKSLCKPTHVVFETEDKKALLVDSILATVFSFLCEHELLCKSSVVCSKWADISTEAHASLMLISVGCSPVSNNDSDDFDDDKICELQEDRIPDVNNESIAESMRRPWNFIIEKFPWGAFLSEGAFKKVYRVWNSSVNCEEAVSVMNVDMIDDKNVVGAELAVSVMLSSLVRRNICPNFVLTRGVFTSAHEPPTSLWGSARDRHANGQQYDPYKKHKKPREPGAEKHGNYQFIRMELCRHGDVEEYIKEQSETLPCPNMAKMMLFQMAFSLHTASDRFGMTHYDVKLLNFFLQSACDSNIGIGGDPFAILRYGVGSHIFNLRMPSSKSLLVKLADFGTANVRPESNGQPVIIGNFTTIENTPADYLILGDAAKQGNGHDCFGLGLCMLHLFTGHAPYEEILENITCPTNLKKKLKKIWESKKPSSGYDVIRSVILSDVYEDEDGHVEGEPDEVLYDTLYRFLVLFGIPKEKFQWKEGCRVWKTISFCLETPQQQQSTSLRPRRQFNPQLKTSGSAPDASQYASDCQAFSFHHGNNRYISRARKNLQKMEGGVELLFSLVSFDPMKRATALDVINSTFMESLRKDACCRDDIVQSFMAYQTK